MSDHARRRAFVFFFVPTALIFSIEALLERDQLTHYVDDVLDVAFALIALSYFAVTRRTPEKVTVANRLGGAVAVAIVAATIFAVSQEINDPEDFGNEIPTLVLGSILIVNGWWRRSGLPGGPPLMAADAKTDKEVSRRWASSLFFAFVLFATLYLVYTGPYTLLAVAINAILILVAVVALLLAFQNRNQFAFESVRRTNNALAGLAAISLIAGVVGGMPPFIFFAAAFLVNRFV